MKRAIIILTLLACACTARADWSSIPAREWAKMLRGEQAAYSVGGLSSSGVYSGGAQVVRFVGTPSDSASMSWGELIPAHYSCHVDASGRFWEGAWEPVPGGRARLPQGVRQATTEEAAAIHGARCGQAAPRVLVVTFLSR